VIGVLRRIHGRKLVAEWRFVAVGLDELGNVLVFVSLQGMGQPRNRSCSRHAGGKAIGVVVDLKGFVVARHHDDALMRLTQYRRLLSQVIKVGVRIVNEPVAAKEIVLFKLLLLIVHIDSLFELLPAGCYRRLALSVANFRLRGNRRVKQAEQSDRQAK